MMQLMPETAQRYGVRDRRDVADNIAGGVSYLRDLLSRFGGNVALALAAYNAGEGAVERHHGSMPRYRETMLYVPRVLEAYARYRNATYLVRDDGVELCPRPRERSTPVGKVAMPEDIPNPCDTKYERSAATR
jgi:hypothetical protein